LEFSTYLDVSGADVGWAVDVGPDDGAYVAGTTTAVADLDGFVVRLAADGTAKRYERLIHTSERDEAYALSVDAAGLAHVAGATLSRRFPVVHPAQAASGGAEDAFVVSIPADGGSPEFATYLGGRGRDLAYGIAVGADGRLHVAGRTESLDFPLQDPVQSRSGGGSCPEVLTDDNLCPDAFLASLASADHAIEFSTYLGGSDFDQALALALDRAENLYVVGRSDSLDFPVRQALQPAQGGGRQGDAFLAKVGDRPLARPTDTPSPTAPPATTAPPSPSPTATAPRTASTTPATPSAWMARIYLPTAVRHWTARPALAAASGEPGACPVPAVAAASAAPPRRSTRGRVRDYPVPDRVAVPREPRTQVSTPGVLSTQVLDPHWLQEKPHVALDTRIPDRPCRVFDRGGRRLRHVAGRNHRHSSPGAGGGPGRLDRRCGRGGGRPGGGGA
jgi:hypothetical protein